MVHPPKAAWRVDAPRSDSTPTSYRSVDSTSVGLARKLERRLERLVDGLSSAIFRGGMHPVELAGRVVRQADLLITEDVAGPTIPNRFLVRVSPKDLPEIDGAALDSELTAALAETAAERGWRTGGQVQVHVQPDARVASGTIACDAAAEPGTQRPWAQLVGQDGVALDLNDNRNLVGRSSDTDVTIDLPEVSRMHAVIFRRSGGIWIADMGSANGTRCAGQPVTAEAVSAHAGDVIEFGPASFALRLV
jgi:hypothetical protein